MGMLYKLLDLLTEDEQTHRDAVQLCLVTGSLGLPLTFRQG